MKLIWTFLWLGLAAFAWPLCLLLVLVVLFMRGNKETAK